MLKTGPFILALIVVLLITSCAPAIATSTPAPILTEEPSIPVTGMALVQGVEIQISQSEPLQVTAILRGQLPDSGCTKISSIDQSREGSTIKLTVSTTTDPAALCAQALTPFEQLVALDASDLQPGTYTVIANGLEQAFEIPVRDRAQFNQMLVEALNARDYGKLKSLMNQSFMIGYWQSEGTTNTPDQAIEQLQRNLLDADSSIVADASKNLSTLLGTDPVKIVGSDVVEASPLFTSGWGDEGKDEAVLFIAKRADGSWYWHGLLFARDGFEKPTPVVPTRPVDTNSYQTNVKYVLAQQDVNIRNGPGTQFSIIGFVAEGQIAEVTGVSADGNWWRVICPDNRVGSCWVSALSNLTKPSNGPAYDTMYPTDVEYITALKDVNIYSGPGTGYSIVGFLAGGQTAQVVGVNADKTWWGVTCGPDGTCWISADPGLTRPTDLAAPADVQSVEVQILESNPVQANAIARGMLPDSGCTTIAGGGQSRIGNIFSVTLIAKRDPQALCVQMLTPFEYSIPLDVSSLLPGSYMVNVNGVMVSFDLPGSVTPELPDPASPAETQPAS